jgi:hypothetical protein
MTAAEPSPRCWGITLGVLVAWFVVCAAASGACGCAPPQLTPQDQADIATHTVLVERCKEVGRGVGRDAGADAALEVYYSCVSSGGR